MEYEKFNPLDASSKFAICGMPIRMDSYRTCSFGCKYCFSNGRTLGTAAGPLQIGNPQSVANRLKRIFDDNDEENFIFLDYLIANRYTWHCGGMSDPFQPCEKAIKATENIVNVTNDYDIHILFSTKSDTYYGSNLNPKLHSFQLSVTNVTNRKDIEPNVSDIKNRINFFKELKNKGFRVGIRIQPFIPNISNIDILETFKDADHFILEGIKMVPNNATQRADIIKITGLTDADFKNVGLMNLKPEMRLELYKPFIAWFEEHNASYSLADNDLHYLGNNKCCCGDALCFNQYSNFNTTTLAHEFGPHYTLDNVYEKLNDSGLINGKCKQLFFSSRQGNCETVKDFYERFFDNKNSVFSPKFFYLQEDIKNE